MSKDCSCLQVQPALRFMPYFMVDSLGRCRMCKGWRPSTPVFLPLRTVIAQELPQLLRQPVVLPAKVFARVSTRGNPSELGVAKSDAFTVYIHRDNIDDFIFAVQQEIRGASA